MKVYERAVGTLRRGSRRVSASRGDRDGTVVDADGTVVGLCRTAPLAHLTANRPF